MKSTIVVYKYNTILTVKSGHVVAESDGKESAKAEVDRLSIAPSFQMTEDDGWDQHEEHKPDDEADEVRDEPGHSHRRAKTSPYDLYPSTSQLALSLDRSVEERNAEPTVEDAEDSSPCVVWGDTMISFTKWKE